MEDDNISVSMAQQALTGVNGGASVPTQPQKSIEPSPFSSVLGQGNQQSLHESALDLAQRTLTRLSRGINPLSGDGAGGSTLPKIDLPHIATKPSGVDGGGLMSIYESIIGGGGGGLPRTSPGAGGGAQRTDQSGIAMLRPVGGGAAIPHYDYNGVSVALPDGVDAKDTASVGKAMGEQNAMIDMFNSIEDEEV